MVRPACALQWRCMPQLRSRCPLPAAPDHGRGTAHAVIAAVLLLALAAAVGDAAAQKTPEKAPAATESGRSALTIVVAGIVSYTRWPAEVRSVRLCTLGQGRGVDDLLASGDIGSTQLSVPVRAAGDVADALNGCDIVYVGTLATDAARSLLQKTVGRPVLMIGEGQEFCTDGGMFCLQPGAAAVGFAANLDAVARSGLRINPRVLGIARSATTRVQ
jgi:hypothetical protein